MRSMARPPTLALALALIALCVLSVQGAGVSYAVRPSRFKQPGGLFKLRQNPNPKMVTPNAFASSSTNGAGVSTTAKEVTPWDVNTRTESIGATGSRGKALGGNPVLRNYHAGAASSSAEVVNSFVPRSSPPSLASWITGLHWG